MRRDVFEILFSSRVLSHFYSRSARFLVFFPITLFLFTPAVSSIFLPGFCFFPLFCIVLLFSPPFHFAPTFFSLLFSIQLLYFYLLHFTVSAANCFLNLYHFPSLSFYSLLRFFFPVLFLRFCIITFLFIRINNKNR